MMAMLFRLRWRLAHLICPELGVEARLKAMRATTGFFDPVAARQHAHQRRSIFRVVEAGQVAKVADPLGCARVQDERKLVSPRSRRIGLGLDEADCFPSPTGNQKVEGLDEAHKNDFQCVNLVFEQFDVLIERDRHLITLHPVVGASDGRGHPAQAKEESARRGSGLLLSLCGLAHAIDDHWIGDLIGAVCLFVGLWGMLLIGFAMEWR